MTTSDEYNTLRAELLEHQQRRMHQKVKAHLKRKQIKKILTAVHHQKAQSHQKIKARLAAGNGIL